MVWSLVVVVLAGLFSRVATLSMSAAAPTTRLPVPKSVAIKQAMLRQLEEVPAEKFAFAATVIESELVKKARGRPVDQSSINWALTSVYKSLTRSLTEECASNDECMVAYATDDDAMVAADVAPRSQGTSRLAAAVLPPVVGALFAVGWLLAARSLVAVASTYLATTGRPVVAAATCWLASTAAGARLATLGAAGGGKALLALVYASGTSAAASAAKFLPRT